MLRSMADKTPPFWRSFFSEFTVGVVALTLAAVALWYFGDDNVAEILRPYLG